MKKLVQSALLLLASSFTFLSNAQTEGSAFTLTGMGVATPFARDYQSLGINPANQDIESQYNKRAAIGFLQGGISLYSEVLTKEELRQNFFREDIKKFDRSQQLEYASLFANSKNNLDVDMLAFGLSFQTPTAGSFGFSVNDRVNVYSSMGNQVSQLLWLGNSAPYFEQLILQNGDTIPNTANISQDTLDQVIKGITSVANAQSITQLIQGTEVRFSWVREYGFGYGKKLWSNDDWQVFGGVGGKFYVGQGLVSIKGENGQAQAFSSLSPLFKVDYDSLAKSNPSALEPNASPLRPVGRGFGLDFGATIIFKEKFILSAAVNNIGSMTWDGNVYTLKDVNLTEFKTSGLESVDFVNQINQLNGSDGLLQWQGTEKITTRLPTSMRLGFGMDVADKFKAGIDIISPLNDDVSSLEKAVIAFGGEYSPIKWVHLQAGMVTGGNYATPKVPLGVYFTVGKGTWEFGVSSRDAFTFIKKNEPTVSLAFGFLRFRM